MSAVYKIIPDKYIEPIKIALAAYPELDQTTICFKLTNHHPVPYGTTLSFDSFFKKKEKRKYIITLLENAKEPVNSALFKNLSQEIQVGVIAHELVHVIQFQNCSIPKLIKTLILYTIPAFKKKIEREADIGAIEHGFGNNLYKHAVYLRNIPGYVKKRPEINKYYLKPVEIQKYIQRFDVITVATSKKVKMK